MRQKIIAFVFAAGLLVAVGVPLFGSGSVSAHVHGITPLDNLSCVVDNSRTGANGTNGTAADDSNGGPITGLIPRDTGKSPLTGGDGGKTAPVPVCD